MMVLNATISAFTNDAGEVYWKEWWQESKSKFKVNEKGNSQFFVIDIDGNLYMYDDQGDLAERGYASSKLAYYPNNKTELPYMAEKPE